MSNTLVYTIHTEDGKIITSGSFSEQKSVTLKFFLDTGVMIILGAEPEDE